MSDYEILGISEDSSNDDATKAFRRLAMKFHPDRNDSPDAEQKFITIKSAYNRIVSGISKKTQKDAFVYEKSKRENVEFGEWLKSAWIKNEKNYVIYLVKHILRMNNFYDKETILYEAYYQLNKENTYLRGGELFDFCNEAYDTFSDNKNVRSFYGKITRLPTGIKVIGLFIISLLLFNVVHFITNFDK